jgi:ribosomal-protein-alanine N-acetyltransferase
MNDIEFPEDQGQLSRISLRTDRLVLIPMAAGQLRLLVSDPKKLEGQLGYGVSRSVVSKTVRRATSVKLSEMRKLPEADRVWITYWLLVVDIKQEKPFGAGLIGFKGRSKRNGIVEIGYGIDEKYRGQGYTTEAVQALIAWAFEQPVGLKAISAQTHRSNLASGRVLEKAGMTVYAEEEDTLYWTLYRPGEG